MEQIIAMRLAVGQKLSSFSVLWLYRLYIAVSHSGDATKQLQNGIQQKQHNIIFIGVPS